MEWHCRSQKVSYMDKGAPEVRRFQSGAAPDIPTLSQPFQVYCPRAAPEEHTFWQRRPAGAYLGETVGHVPAPVDAEGTLPPRSAPSMEKLIFGYPALSRTQYWRHGSVRASN